MDLKVACIFFLFVANVVLGQNNVVTIDERYLEDQLYLGLSYSLLNEKPSIVKQNGFSGTIESGFIKDLPLNKERNIGFGLGVGIGHTVIIHNLKINQLPNTNAFEIAQAFDINRFSLTSIDIPLEFRWRTSTIEEYNFFRVYAGIKIKYLVSGNFKFKDNLEEYKINHSNLLETWSYGVQVSAGYSTWNLNVYYGLTPILKNASLNNKPFDISEVSLGLKFYML